MATERYIEVTTDIAPVYAVPGLTHEAAQKASKLLNENHENFHIFFNKSGFHNHIVHHLLSTYALGADPSTLQKNYRDNAGYQNQAKSLKDAQAVIDDLHDPATFIKNLGPNVDKCYTKFLAFFQSEIAKKGWEQVVNEYLLADDERGQEMLARLFGGYLHPLIHVGFGIEFEQPAIIAEGLAEAAAHGGKLKSFFLQAEQEANKLKQSGEQTKSLMQLLKHIHADSELTDSTRWSDDNKIEHGILVRAPERMIHHASQYFVRDESELEKRTAEMIHLSVYYASAAQKPNKQPKYDFFNIHATNSSIFYSKFLKLPHLSTANKIRLLEWKARVDLVLYAACHSPQLLPDVIKEYRATEQYPDKSKDAWAKIYDRATSMDDDGHTPKLIRALAHAKEICTPFENDESLQFEIRADTWDKLGKMAIESVSAGGPMWIRGAGWEEAWKDVPDRKARL